ncbi:SDR family NAD(P)-dependent oxidoreductase [Micromonospora sp. U21]|jgi:NAD(P)-dependent dehydrogenase (short-subunit alcohol dehydrogenase family)|uniref:SDR family NAD(P)-dependent oxidoreductase n=1 Tax=Micromonospora sp. U21 TaxID=2824899 RepID=UPI001FFD4642|nr:SDR family oxidoreductase [Micromonospora sp. U21]
MTVNESGLMTSTQSSPKVAIVTGAGSGIGAATALEFASSGIRVLGVGRREEALRRTAKQHSLIDYVTADLHEPTAPDEVVRTAVERWGRLDVVVNNAGTYLQAPLQEVSDDAVSDLITIHIVAPTRLTRAALPLLKASRGSVVNISSTYGHRPIPGSSHYGAVKAALEHLTQSWALELAPDGIRVNAVAPGPTESEVITAAGFTAAEKEAIAAAQIEMIPLRRRGTPEDIARWIVHLAGPDADWVTGQILTVDGGLELL